MKVLESRPLFPHDDRDGDGGRRSEGAEHEASDEWLTLLRHPLDHAPLTALRGLRLPWKRGEA